MLLTISDGINSFAQFITVLVLFIFVLGLTYITTRYIAGYQKDMIRTGNMELIETLRISNNKYLQIVRTGNRYLVMAVCKDTVTMLTTLQEDELNLKPQEAKKEATFKGILEKASKQFGNQKQATDEGIDTKK